MVIRREVASLMSCQVRIRIVAVFLSVSQLLRGLVLLRQSYTLLG
jgi:hypothetical protein